MSKGTGAGGDRTAEYNADDTRAKGTSQGDVVSRPVGLYRTSHVAKLPGISDDYSKSDTRGCVITNLDEGATSVISVSYC